MNTFSVEIVTPLDREAFEHVVSLNVPAGSGRMGILANHQPTICDLKDGVVILKDNTGATTRRDVDPGTLTVAHNRATVLVKASRPPREPTPRPGSPAASP